METRPFVGVRPATHALKGLYHTYSRGLTDFKNLDITKLKRPS